MPFDGFPWTNKPLVREHLFRHSPALSRAPGTALEAATTYAYDANGNLTLVTLPNGVTVAYTYDNAQRLTGIEDALGNTIAYTLDAAGNITQEDTVTNEVIHVGGPRFKYGPSSGDLP